MELESRLAELTEQNASLTAQISLLSQQPVPPSEAPPPPPPPPAAADVTSEVASLRQECDLLREMLQHSKQNPPSHKSQRLDSRPDDWEVAELKRIVFRFLATISRQTLSL